MLCSQQWCRAARSSESHAFLDVDFFDNCLPDVCLHDAWELCPFIIRRIHLKKFLPFLYVIFSPFVIVDEKLFQVFLIKSFEESFWFVWLSCFLFFLFLLFKKRYFHRLSLGCMFGLSQKNFDKPWHHTS